MFEAPSAFDLQGATLVFAITGGDTQIDETSVIVQVYDSNLARNGIVCSINCIFPSQLIISQLAQFVAQQIPAGTWAKVTVLVSPSPYPCIAHTVSLYSIPSDFL